MINLTKKILTSFDQFGDNRIHFVPKLISNLATMTYLLAIMACTLLYSSYILNWKWWIFGIVSVIGFLHLANRQTKVWIKNRTTTFAKQLFWSAFALRVVWVLISYFLYKQWTGTPFSIGAADELFYNDVALKGANMLRDGKWNLFQGLSYIFFEDR